MTYRSYLFLSLVMAVSMAGCNRSGQDRVDPIRTSVPVTVQGVTLEKVLSTSLPESLEVVGTVRSRTIAQVSVRLPGVINLMKVREGDRVKKGQLLATLDAKENMSNSAFAAAGIDDAHRGLEEAQLRKRLAETTFERYQRLYNEQAVTRQEFDVKQAERDLAVQGVARAEARLKQSREGAGAAGAMADYTKITAPISGVISSRQVDIGTSVYPAQPLMTIEEDGSYQLELSIPESLAGSLRKGTTVAVSVDALSAEITAKIDDIVPAVDPSSRTYVAKINLYNKGLRSGMFGRGAINLESVRKGITVPQKALMEKGALTSVWVVDNNRIAHLRLVKVGRIQNGRAEIVSGLLDGELVAVAGVEKVTEGTRVE